MKSFFTSPSFLIYTERKERRQQLKCEYQYLQARSYQGKLKRALSCFMGHRAYIFYHKRKLRITLFY